MSPRTRWQALRQLVAPPAPASQELSPPPRQGRTRRTAVPLRCQFQLRNGHIVRLTRQQLVILAGIVSGWGNHQIAVSMGLSTKTIKNYVGILYDELGIPEHAQGDLLLTRRVRAAVLAATEGLVPTGTGHAVGAITAHEY